ncbi:SDR family oxidoreductase [Mucilaginibacter rubeus]|uniref:SDR family oxidoreductase n=2 Tax=Mucilaginibacter TaxID=423349 RepID=A0AAE6MJY5_9SPHI|nr:MULTISPECIES: SDR family oxidoreductase [Mucilaginibacter]QEM06096.1 SDR family oxidoreductase [Mucilaginibacter rubeus]QEM18676.1 SDR family oxidoreductase [Mucilaginibacter gossypii]QTE44781.1 SDR family oxidoreductase [Mucilaginibacter rubeus]QTE51379.1 SDR family oxidoreductase [Mucilaginibacter rubeus]QTE56466.1 SDR family oxidoreductase [Mucilaginibacter rubeus]
MESIKDKVIVITGASSGIGASAARKLAQLGAKVVLAARREDQLKNLAQEIGENAIYVVTDVARRTDLDNVILQTIAKFGRVDVMWNNAGIMPISFFEEGHVDEWDKMIDINIKGVLYGINAVLPHMLERGQGHILSTSSVGGLKTSPGIGVYSGTKFAVKAIMETLREEVAQNIKVTTIYPGATKSELGHDITSPKIKGLYGNLANMPKLDEEAIANAVIYAISQPDNISVNEVVVRPLGQTR